MEDGPRTLPTVGRGPGLLSSPLDPDKDNASPLDCRDDAIAMIGIGRDRRDYRPTEHRLLIPRLDLPALDQNQPLAAHPESASPPFELGPPILALRASGRASQADWYDASSGAGM